MKCADIMTMLDSLLDNELPTQTSAELVGHMKECSHCSHEWHELSALRERMHAFRAQIAVPQTLSRDIHRYVRGKQPALLFPGWAYAAAIAMLLFVAASFKNGRQEPRHGVPASVLAAKPAMCISEVLEKAPLFIAESQSTLDPTCLSKQAGFNVCPLELPGWKLASAKLVRTTGSRICMAQLTYINAKSETVVCYQSCAGKIQTDGLNHHNIAGRLFCCGAIGKLSVVYFPKDGHDFFLVSELPQQDLMELAQQS